MMEADQLLQEARAAANAGNRKSAREILERAVAQDPSNAQAWYLLSQVVDDDQRVIDCLEKVLEIDPYSKQAQGRLKRWQSKLDAPETLEDEDSELSPQSQALETAEESVGGSTAVGVGALLLLLVIVGLALRVGLISFGRPKIPRDQLSYEVHLPSDYSEDRKWPVFVGVHGFGGSMANCLERWGEYIDPNGIVLVCPGLSDERGGWYQDVGEEALEAILGYIQRDYSVEPQVFLAGFSAGGQFVQGFAFSQPDRVYAVSVLSAGNYYEPIKDAAHIPFLVVIGERDNPTSLGNARVFTDLLAEKGYEYEYHILPNVGHHVSHSAKELTIDFFRRVSGAAE
jgi:predicted esterase